MSDGYSAWRMLGGLKHLGCLAHVGIAYLVSGVPGWRTPRRRQKSRGTPANDPAKSPAALATTG